MYVTCRKVDLASKLFSVMAHMISPRDYTVALFVLVMLVACVCARARVAWS